MHTCDALPPPGHPRGTADDARIRATYDAVAGEYHRQLAGELAAKPLDRALLGAVCELAAGGTLADVGCGPGHVTRFLADHHPDVVGVDLSPAMVALAREQAPGLRFVEASMLELPVPDDAWAGAVALYSVIHLDARGRAAAFAELAACCGGAGCFTVHVRRVGALDELYAAEAADLLRELVATGPALGWVDPRRSRRSGHCWRRSRRTPSPPQGFATRDDADRSLPPQERGSWSACSTPRVWARACSSSVCPKARS